MTKKIANKYTEHLSSAITKNLPKGSTLRLVEGFVKFAPYRGASRFACLYYYLGNKVVWTGTTWVWTETEGIYMTPSSEAFSTLDEARQAIDIAREKTADEFVSRHGA